MNHSVLPDFYLFLSWLSELFFGCPLTSLAASPEFPLLVPTLPVQPLKIRGPKTQVSVLFSIFSHSPVISSGLPVLNVFFPLMTSKFFSLGYVTLLNSRLKYPTATSPLIYQTKYIQNQISDLPPVSVIVLVRNRWHISFR